MDRGPISPGNSGFRSIPVPIIRRGPDETFETLSDLRQHCRLQKEQSVDVWHMASGLIPHVEGDGLNLQVGTDGAYTLNHWSFWQQGYPAVMVTDTALFRYGPYHTREDTPDKVVHDRLARVVAGLERVVFELAGPDPRD